SGSLGFDSWCQRLRWLAPAGQQARESAEQIGAGRQGLAVAATDHLDGFGQEIDDKISDRGNGDQEDRGECPSETSGHETFEPEQHLQKEWDRKKDGVQIEKNNQSEKRQKTIHCVTLFRPEAREVPAFSDVVPVASS